MNTFEDSLDILVGNRLIADASPRLNRSSNGTITQKSFFGNDIQHPFIECQAVFITTFYDTLAQTLL